MARNKQFKAESKKLLDLMINSIYTNRDIFLRELISNASDADDKLYYKSLEDPSLSIDRQNLDIKVTIKPQERQLIISDNGIGMTKEQLEEYLGTIAKSGSYDFKQESENTDVIGQFGVGFYASFMVSDDVRVVTKAFGQDVAYEFFSEGVNGYWIKETEKETHGTDVILTIRENTDEIDYNKYLDPKVIEGLVQTYSDYIRYPILLEDNRLNSITPIWKKTKADVSVEEYNDFYKSKYGDFEDPMETILMKVEGIPSFDALLYIPNHAPLDFYTPQYEIGLNLYSRGVSIMEHNKELIPEYFRFVKGLVDSPDLPLNISREVLQNDRALHQISQKIKRRIKTDLEKLLLNDYDKYKKFWENFGISIKFGIYTQFGRDKEFLLPLLLLNSSYDNSLTTLKDYHERKKDEQKHIYYVSADSIQKCKELPQTQYVLNKEYEVLYLTDEIDEFMIKGIHEFEGLTFKSVMDENLDLETQEEKDEIEKDSENYKTLIESLESILHEKIERVEISNKLEDIPAYLKGAEGISTEMEKVLKSMPNANTDLEFKRILEINSKHPLIEKINTISEEELKDFAWLLYDNACLVSGLEIENTDQYIQRVTNLMMQK